MMPPKRESKEHDVSLRNTADAGIEPHASQYARPVSVPHASGGPIHVDRERRAQAPRSRDGFDVLARKRKAPENTLKTKGVFRIALTRVRRLEQVVAERRRARAFQLLCHDSLRSVLLEARCAVKAFKIAVGERNEHSKRPRTRVRHKRSALSDPQCEVVDVRPTRIDGGYATLAQNRLVHEQAIEERVNAAVTRLHGHSCT
jgi:hypothetical protein